MNQEASEGGARELDIVTDADFVPSSAEVQSCVTVEISFFTSLRRGKKRKKKVPGTEVFAFFLSMA